MSTALPHGTEITSTWPYRNRMTTAGPDRNRMALLIFYRNKIRSVRSELPYRYQFTSKLPSRNQIISAVRNHIHNQTAHSQSYKITSERRYLNEAVTTRSNDNQGAPAQHQQIETITIQSCDNEIRHTNEAVMMQSHENQINASQEHANEAVTTQSVNQRMSSQVQPSEPVTIRFQSYNVLFIFYSYGPDEATISEHVSDQHRTERPPIAVHFEQHCFTFNRPERRRPVPSNGSRHLYYSHTNNFYFGASTGREFTNRRTLRISRAVFNSLEREVKAYHNGEDSTLREMPPATRDRLMQQMFYRLIGGVHQLGMSEVEINNIPNSKYTGLVGGTSESERCNVCLSDYQEGDYLRHFSCGHTFHKNCMDQWLKNNITCPLCRNNLKIGCELIWPSELSLKFF